MVYTTRAASREDAPLRGVLVSPAPFPIKLRTHNLVAGCAPSFRAGASALSRVRDVVRFLTAMRRIKVCFSIVKVSL